MAKQTQQDNGATAVATSRKPVRRYNLDREQRAFLTSMVLPMFTQRMSENADALEKVANAGGNDFITPDGARMMAWQAKHNAETAMQIVAALTYSDASDDTSDNGDLDL